MKDDSSNIYKMNDQLQYSKTMETAEYVQIAPGKIAVYGLYEA